MRAVHERRPAVPKPLSPAVRITEGRPIPHIPLLFRDLGSARFRYDSENLGLTPISFP